MSLVTGSIVLFNNPVDVLIKAINSFLNTETNTILYLIDNSPSDLLKGLVNDNRVIYIHNPSNPGFGASHNLAIDHAFKLCSKYHFIINPDIFFHDDVITPMVNYMVTHPDVGMLMPQILYPNGDIQYLPKLLPSFAWLVKRKLKFSGNGFKKFIDRYELRTIPSNKIYNSPILSGCFSLLNMDAIKNVGAYDDSFFMYFEDFDLSRRIHKKYKTLYYPEVSVYHEYERGANKSIKLFIIFLKSAIRYYKKWGWLDAERKQINKKALEQFL